MKPYISENPKNCRISTYLTADEVIKLSKVVGNKTVASWLRDLVLTAIEDHEVYLKSLEARQRQLNKKVQQLEEKHENNLHRS